MDAPFRLPTARHYIEFGASASPIQRILSRLDPAAQRQAWDEMEQQLHVFSAAGEWIGPDELLLAAGRRAQTPR